MQYFSNMLTVSNTTLEFGCRVDLCCSKVEETMQATCVAAIGPYDLEKLIFDIYRVTQLKLDRQK